MAQPKVKKMSSKFKKKFEYKNGSEGIECQPRSAFYFYNFCRFYNPLRIPFYFNGIGVVILQLEIGCPLQILDGLQIHLMRLGCMTCMEMSGSGLKIGLQINPQDG